MRPSTIKYFFKEAFINIFRNALMSTASVLTIASCIFFLLTSFNIASNVDYMLENLQNSIGFTVFINDDVSDDEIIEIQNTIESAEHIKSVEYVSQQDAFDNFSETLGDRNKILTGLPRDTLLPRSFNIMLDDNINAEATINEFEQYVGEDNYFSSINHAYEETDMLIVFNNWVRIISLVLIVGFAFIATVIIFNTVKITMSSRRNEINIMKYLGSTDWFIRFPFIIEGVLIGFFGALIPTAITYIAYNKVMEKAAEHLEFLNNIFVYQDSLELVRYGAPLALVLGIGIGVLGSMISIRKYLDV